MENKRVAYTVDRSLEGYLFCLLFGAIGLGIGFLFLKSIIGLVLALLIGFSFGVALGFLLGRVCFSNSKEKQSFYEAYADCLLLIFAEILIIATIVGVIWLLATLF